MKKFEQEAVAMPLSPECQSIQTTIDDLKVQRAAAWADLKAASANGDIHGRWAAARLAASLTRKILDATKALADCVAAHPSTGGGTGGGGTGGGGTGGGTAPPVALDAVFTCDGTTTIDLPGSGETQFDFKNLAISVRFNAERTEVEVTNFVYTVGPVTLPPNSPVGAGEEINIEVTVKEGGRGFFDRETGAVSIPLSLEFNVDRDWWFVHEDSKVPLTLSTEPPGSNLEADGKLTLAGDGRVASDWLNPLSNRRVAIVCAGNVAPIP